MFPVPMMSRASIKGVNEYHAKLEREAAEKKAAEGGNASANSVTPLAEAGAEMK